MIALGERQTIWWCVKSIRWDYKRYVARGISPPD
jgi:hypothetical protein